MHPFEVVTPNIVMANEDTVRMVTEREQSGDGDALDGLRRSGRLIYVHSEVRIIRRIGRRVLRPIDLRVGKVKVIEDRGVEDVRLVRQKILRNIGLAVFV